MGVRSFQAAGRLSAVAGGSAWGKEEEVLSY